MSKDSKKVVIKDKVRIKGRDVTLTADTHADMKCELLAATTITTIVAYGHEILDVRSMMEELQKHISHICAMVMTEEEFGKMLHHVKKVAVRAADEINEHQDEKAQETDEL